MPFKHMTYAEGEHEEYVEQGVTKHTVDRTWDKKKGTRFHCSSCGKKNVEHYKTLSGGLKTVEERKEYAKKNSGSYCYLEGKSKTCEPCLKLKRENSKKFGRKTKTQLADERTTLIAIIARLDPNYIPQNIKEAKALGVPWKKEKEEEPIIKEEPEEPVQPVKTKKKSRRRKLLVIEDDEEDEDDA
jgi:hypothetical protein